MLSFLAGAVSEATRPATNALITDLVPSSQRLVAFAVWRVVINLAWVVALGVGGALIDSFGFGPVFVVDALTSFVMAGLVVLFLPESRPVVTEAGRPGFGPVIADRRFRRVWWAQLLIAIVYSQSIAVIPLVLAADAVSRTDIGRLLALNGLLIVCFEVPLTSFTRRLDPRVAMSAGAVLIGGGLAATVVAGGSLGWLAAAVAVWTLGEITAMPVALAYVSELAPVALRGRYAGAFSLAFTLGNALGPALGGAALAGPRDVLWAGILAATGASALGFWRLPAARPLIGEASPVMEDG